MANIKPFKGIRPKAALAASIASKPYDVLNEKEARQEAEGHPYSFYHVIKPEMDFPDDFDHYAPVPFDLQKKLMDQHQKDTAETEA